MDQKTAIDMIASYTLFAITMGIIIKLLWTNTNKIEKLLDMMMDKFDKTEDRIIQLGSKISKHDERIYKAESRLDIMDEWRKNLRDKDNP